MGKTIIEKYTKMPKENYGSISSNRFAYQRFWGILKAFELYKEGKEFYVVFEGAEDIDVVTDSIAVYQIKTEKERTYYTLNSMKKIKNSGSSSPLSKLANKERIDGVTSLNIVSNLPFEKIYQKSGIDYDRITICFADFDERFAANVISHVLSMNGFAPDLAKYHFIHSLLPIDDTKSAMVGHAVEFFRGYDAPGETIEMCLNLIMSDAEAMMNKEECDDHLSDKALSKAKMDEYINRFSSSRNTLTKECAEIIDQFPVSIKSQINRCFTKVIEANFNSVIINENKRIVSQYILTNLSELSSFSREKEWCEYILENIKLPNVLTDGDKLCLIILAVNDYRKGVVNENE